MTKITQESMEFGRCDNCGENTAVKTCRNTTAQYKLCLICIKAGA